MAQIIVMDGPGVGRTFELSNMNSIGRGDSCNIRLSSPKIHEQQATIQLEGNSYSIVSSIAGGVLVNGQSIQQSHKLSHGDMITLADIMLLYGEDNQQSAANPLASPDALPPHLQESTEEQPTIKSRQRFYNNTESAIAGMSETKQASRNMEVLLKISNAIMSKLEVRDLLQHLLDIIFGELPADRGTIFLRDLKTNKLWPMATKTASGIPVSDKVMGSRTIIRNAFETKEGVLTKDAQEDNRWEAGMSIAQQNIHAAICVPMVGKNEQVLGIIHIDTTRADRVFNEDHLRLVTAIAMQASLSIENALLVQQLGEKKRIEQELDIASNIQMELLPKPEQFPKMEGLDVYGVMIPAKEVGGDYYDFLLANDGSNKAFICIGDVSGKGVPAGLVMVMARCFFRPLILSSKNTKEVVDELNKFLVEDTRKDMFMSMLVLAWHPDENKFTWTGAGHEHLIIYRAATKTCKSIRAGGIVLGMMKRADKFFKEQEFTLDTGDALILYTDGVTEAVSEDDGMFSLEEVEELVLKHVELDSAKEINDNILKDLQLFMGKAPQHDDITLVTVKKT